MKNDFLEKFFDELVDNAKVCMNEIYNSEFSNSTGECGEGSTSDSQQFTVEVLPGGKMPERSNDSDCCFDGFAMCPTKINPDRTFSQYIRIEPWDTYVVPLGFKVDIPKGWELQVRSRSGTASKGVVIANSPGTVDSGYTGEVCAILFNQSGEAVTINHHDRICQLKFDRVPSVELVPGTVNKKTSRGTNGFGSTGA